MIVLTIILDLIVLGLVNLFAVMFPVVFLAFLKVVVKILDNDLVGLVFIAVVMVMRFPVILVGRLLRMRFLVVTISVVLCGSTGLLSGGAILFATLGVIRYGLAGLL